MGDDSSEKTEEPTPHKLKEARDKGQTAKSKDLTSAILIIVSFYTLKVSSRFIWEQCTNITIYTFALISEPFSVSLAGHILMETMRVFAIVMTPLFGANVLVALLVESLQTGFAMSLDPLTPELNKINPIEGAKKFFSMKQYVELLKSIIKMTIVIYILWQAISEEFFMVVIAQQLSLWQVMNFTGEIVMKVVVRVGIFYLIIAFFDYFYQRYEYIKGLKMSKKEIKDEYKRLEGDPTVKQRQRDAQREMSQGRQMGSVPDADVVVTNPIHIAIAIKYAPNTMRAPKVVAKGKRLVAKEIKRLAEQHYIPIVENPPLARSLYTVSQAGKEVPPQFYKAIAEILAFIYNLKRKRKQRF